MELVKGVPLTRYCDEARLTLRERLGRAVARAREDFRAVLKEMEAPPEPRSP